MRSMLSVLRSFANFVWPHRVRAAGLSVLILSLAGSELLAQQQPPGNNPPGQNAQKAAIWSGCASRIRIHCSVDQPPMPRKMATGTAVRQTLILIR